MPVDSTQTEPSFFKLVHEICRSLDELTMHFRVFAQARETQCGKYVFLVIEMRDDFGDEYIDAGGKVSNRLAIQHRGE